MVKISRKLTTGQHSSSEHKMMVGYNFRSWTKRFTLSLSVAKFPATSTMRSDTIDFQTISPSVLSKRKEGILDAVRKFIFYISFDLCSCTYLMISSFSVIISSFPVHGYLRDLFPIAVCPVFCEHTTEIMAKMTNDFNMIVKLKNRN